jgi:hypothetical protein
MNIIIRRFLEFFIIEALLSAICAFIFNYIWESTPVLVIISAFLGILIYITVQILMLRRCFLDLREPLYYLVYNFLAYIFVIFFNFILIFTLSPSVYTYFYFITKILYFANQNFDSFLSAIIFHIFMIALIFIAPIGLGERLAQMDLFDEFDMTESYSMTDDYVITNTEGDNGDS